METFTSRQQAEALLARLPSSSRAPPIFPRRAVSRCSVAGPQSGTISAAVQEAVAFAPATVANLGPGFDWLGCAVEGKGDWVVARPSTRIPAGQLEIKLVRGADLSLAVDENCAGIAARETLALFDGKVDCGVELELYKGLPLGSGLGSSAASAAAACQAVNSLFGEPVGRDKLVLAGLESEAVVSGRHADNIAPAVLGNFVMVRPDDPTDLLPLPSPTPFTFVLVNPLFKAPTAEMRKALRPEVPMAAHVSNCQAGAALVAAICAGDALRLGEALDRDSVVEPARGPLIPGFAAVKEAAKAAGAYGCTISGAGPTCVAVVETEQVGHDVAKAMEAAFQSAGNLQVNFSQVVHVDLAGARSVERSDVPNL